MVDATDTNPRLSYLGDCVGSHLLSSPPLPSPPLPSQGQGRSRRVHRAVTGLLKSPEGWAAIALLLLVPDGLALGPVLVPRGATRLTHSS